MQDGSALRQTGRPESPQADTAGRKARTEADRAARVPAGHAEVGTVRPRAAPLVGGWHVRAEGVSVFIDARRVAEGSALCTRTGCVAVVLDPTELSRCRVSAVTDAVALCFVPSAGLRANTAHVQEQEHSPQGKWALVQHSRGISTGAASSARGSR